MGCGDDDGREMTARAPLRVRFWGVRGSHPVPGASTLRVGGNSSCVALTAGDHTMVFDAGTGIINLGNQLIQRRGGGVVHIFLSHTHHDHIEGLRFFQPLYSPQWTCHVYGAGSGPKTVERVLAAVMQPRLFPVSLAELPTPLTIHTLGTAASMRFSGSPALQVEARHSHAHPKVGVMLYRVTYGRRVVVYATDVEAAKGGLEDVAEFARGADVLIHDAQYTDDEYFSKVLDKAGWGHSTVRMAAAAARAARVGQLILYHHDPTHDDVTMGRLERQALAIFPRSRIAVEGLELRLLPRRVGARHFRLRSRRRRPGRRDRAAPSRRR
jgi:phosphoribosyl 1,2-cyclic phosphodiesterase